MSPKLIDVLDESKQKFGTWKDRRSEFIVRNAVARKVDSLVIITSGNAGFSLANHASEATIKTTCVVDHSISGSILEKLESASRVIKVDLSESFLDSKSLISLARRYESEIYLDATSGFSAAYENILDDYLDKHYDYILCPVGSGEAFLGIYMAIKNNSLNSKLICVTAKHYPSFADKLSANFYRHKEELATVVNNGEGHNIIKLGEGEIEEMYNLFKDKLCSEPSATVPWSQIDKLPESSRVLLINSGKGIF